MGHGTITLTRDGPITTMTFTRPEKLNAINRQFLSDLQEATAELNEDAAVRAVVVVGAGRAFSSGADINEFPQDNTPETIDFLRRRAKQGLRALRSLVDLEAPTIAAVKGWAIGGGVSLMMACDFRILAEDAGFYIPEVQFGVPYVWTSSVLLTRLVGPAKAKELILTGDRFDAHLAKEVGLANQVVPADQVLNAARALADKIAAKPVTAVRQSKLIINGLMAPFGDLSQYEPEFYALCQTQPAMQQARDNFFDRRG